MASNPIFPDIAPFPTADVKPAHGGPGHNRPPIEDDVRAQFREKLLGERPTFLQRVEDIEAASGRVVVNSDETLGKAGELVKMIRAHSQYVDETHKAVKAPYLAAGRVADAERNALANRLQDARAKVEQPMNAYAAEKLQREREEAAAAAEARRKLEALAKDAGIETALPPVDAVEDRGPVRSDAGATVSLQTEHVAIIEDFTKAFRKVKDDAGVQEAIQKAIQRIVKATKGNTAIPGVRIEERAKTVSR